MIQPRPILASRRPLQIPRTRRPRLRANPVDATATITTTTARADVVGVRAAEEVVAVETSAAADVAAVVVVEVVDAVERTDRLLASNKNVDEMR